MIRLGKYFEGIFFRRILLGIFLLIALFSSFDVFFKISLFGFNLRFAQILIFFLLALSPIYFIYRKEIRLNGALIFLLAWMLLQLLFLQNSIYLIRGVFYWIWLLSFVILLIFGFQIGREMTKREFDFFFKAYLATFGLIALFGLFQSLVPLLGLAERGPFQTQTWLQLPFIGISLPRINGFNYEPSYFVTYLLPAVPMIFYFVLQSKSLKWFWRGFFLFVAGMMFFSTARTGIFFLLLTLGLLFLYWILTRFPIKRYKKVYLTGMGVSLVLMLTLVLFPPTRKLLVMPFQYVAGDSSFNTRSSGQIEVLVLFFKHPFLGYSLGGIAPALTSLHHIIVDSNGVTKAYEGMNVFFELLVSSGLFGFFLFLLFQALLFGDSLKIYRISQKQQVKDLIFLISFAVLIQFMMLFLNQNILRIYFWFNLMFLFMVQQVVKAQIMGTVK